MDSYENRTKKGFRHVISYDPDLELYGPGDVDYGHNLAEYFEEKKKQSSLSEAENNFEKVFESPLEKSLRLVNNLYERKDVGIREKQRVLSQVRKWGCYSLNDSPWEMNSKQINFFFTDVLNYLRKELDKVNKETDKK